MTGTASSNSKMYFDFDSYKNQEWLRRRKLRIEQVRKQSSHIAKMLRQKAVNEEQVRTHELKKNEEAKFRYWKAEKLDEMERKLRCALEEFGMGHKLAESEPEPDEIIHMKNKINTFRAQERGDIAMEEELKKKKFAEEQKNSIIERKKMTRKLENLRSALICSISNRKDLVNLRQKEEVIGLPNDHQEGEKISKKVTVMKKKVFEPEKSHKDAEISKKVIVQKRLQKSQKSDDKLYFQVNKACIGNKAIETEVCSSEKSDPVWINLDSIEMPLSSRSSKTASHFAKSQKLKKEKTNCTIEFYDHPSRYYCKSLRDHSNLVERINPDSQYDAVELAKKEEEESSETKKKYELDILSQERGNKALRREKINRDCNFMMEKLRELQKKEKVMKAQQRVSSNFMYMTDERLSERIKTKQRVMESKFENIFYEATSGIIPQEPRLDIPHVKDNYYKLVADTGDTHFEDPSTKLSFSPGNLKTTSPVTSLDVPLESIVKNSPSVTARRSKKKKSSKKKKKKLLSEIERTLEKGRKLREMVAQSRENTPSALEESSDVEKKGNECLTHSKTVEPSPRGNGEIKHKSVKSQDRESQTEELKAKEVPVDKEVELKPLYINIVDKTGDVSLPLSTSTSYKSPPSTMRSYRLCKFLEFLEHLGETEENHDDSKLKGEILMILNDLLSEANSFYSEETNMRRSCTEETLNRNLEYYILKLLNMSRECIANLSVSTLNVSSPVNGSAITNLDEGKGNEKGHGYEVFKALHDEEESIKNSELRRSDEEGQIINDWKTILGNLRQTLPTGERNLTKHSSLEKIDMFQHCKMFRKSESSGWRKNETVFHMEEDKAAEAFSSSTKSKYERIKQKCSERISELSNMLEKVRMDKEKLLNSTSGGSSLSVKGDRMDDLAHPKKEQELFQTNLICENFSDGDYFKNFSVLESFIDRYNLSRENKDFSIKGGKDSESFCNPEELATSLESLPDVMNELLQKEIITSPFKWSSGGPSPELILEDETEWKPSSIESVVNNFRKEMCRVKSLSLMSSDTIPRLSSSVDEEYQENIPDFDTSKFIRCERKQNGNANGFYFHEESSVESINHALTKLGLNWAKSFLRKNKESKAMSSSSGSDSNGNK